MMTKNDIHSIVGIDISHLYPNVSIRIERITPKVAEHYLSLNIRNRDMKRSPIDTAIVNGEWMLNGATIVFDENGMLIDGQNRLSRCIAAGMPIDTIVVRGIKREAQLVMDNGTKRTLADQLKMLGYPDANNFAAVVTALQRKDAGSIEDGCGKASAAYLFTIKSSVNFAADNYERIRRIHRLSRRAYKNNAKSFRLGTVACVIDGIIQVGCDEEDLEEFINQLNGSSTPSQPVHMMRHRIELARESNNFKPSQIEWAALLIKTWNAYITGSEIGVLRYRRGGKSPEAFPSIVKTM